MDRVFTVEGLTVTYMPRGPGVGNADAIQQRARFFGYKRRYLGFCRIYLEQDALTAFEQYVSHEDEMHEQLKTFGATGKPLRDWKRCVRSIPGTQAMSQQCHSIRLCARPVRESVVLSQDGFKHRMKSRRRISILCRRS